MASLISPHSRRLAYISAATIGIAMLYHSTAAAFTYLGSQPSHWDSGLNTASLHGFTAPDGPASPGGASWSAMPSGVSFSDALGGGEETSGGGRHPDGDLNTDIEFLLTSEVDGLEYALFDAAYNVWASAAGITNLGQVPDGATLLPSGAVGDPDSSNGHVGDIRVGSFDFVGVDADNLVETFQPGTDAIFGAGGTIAGDVHFNRGIRWINDPNDPSAGNDYDFFTVALHELGHALGLGHSDDPVAVMYEFYSGSRRTLQEDDIAGITALYGTVPEPSALAMAAIGLLAYACRRRHWGEQ